MHFAVRARARSKCVLAARRPAAQAAKRQNRCLGPLAISTIIGMRLRRETYLRTALQMCSHHMRQSRMLCLWAAVPAHSRGKKLSPRPVARARNKAKAPAGHDTAGLGCFN